MHYGGEKLMQSGEEVILIRN